jgi:phosphoribosylanthranilate isomerase
MPTLVKICGLSSPETVDAAIDAGADFVGFVFFPGPPRHVGVERAKALAALARGRAGTVALSVDADDAALDAIVATVRPDLLQLHGHESAARVAVVKRRFGLPVVKALPVASAADLDALAAYEGIADWILFDARPPKDATRPGGLGRPFDWHLLEGIKRNTPFLLSGGLDADNVAQALQITHANGVDVSSGVERAPGEKDPDKIRAFIRAVRAAQPAASGLPKPGLARSA